MPKSYSEDLRWRAVWLSVVRGMTYQDIAKVLFMSEKSVYRYLSSFHSTGSVEPKDHTGGPGKCLSDVEQLTILQCLVHKPTIFLDEVQEQLYKSTGKWVHASTICRTINKMASHTRRFR